MEVDMNVAPLEAIQNSYFLFYSIGDNNKPDARNFELLHDVAN
jgi:hypothetical protein